MDDRLEDFLGVIKVVEFNAKKIKDRLNNSDINRFHELKRIIQLEDDLIETKKQAIIKIQDHLGY